MIHDQLHWSGLNRVQIFARPAVGNRECSTGCLSSVCVCVCMRVVELRGDNMQVPKTANKKCPFQSENAIKESANTNVSHMYLDPGT